MNGRCREGTRRRPTLCSPQPFGTIYVSSGNVVLFTTKRQDKKEPALRRAAELIRRQADQPV